MWNKQRKDGMWRAGYRGPDGKAINRHFPRQVDGKRWLDEVTASLVGGSWVAPERSRVTFAAWSQDWLTARAVRLRASTLARDEAYLRSLILPTFGPVPLVKITQASVQAWVVRTHKAGKAAATTGKAYQILAACLASAVAAGSLSRSPCVGVQLPRIEREEMRFLTNDEVAELAAAMPERWRTLVLVAAYGGLRIGELAALRRHRVDVLRSTVTVVETLSEVRGELVATAPKTRAGRRTVTLPRPVMDALAAHLGQYAAPEANGLVFVSRYDGPLRLAAWRRRVWQPAVNAAGLAPLRVHDLRHTAVALWIAAGASLAQVKQRAGHESAAFTITRYGHLYEGGDAALLDGLSAGFVAPRGAGTVLPLRAAADSCGLAVD